MLSGKQLIVLMNYFGRSFHFSNRFFLLLSRECIINIASEKKLEIRRKKNLPPGYLSGGHFIEGKQRYLKIYWNCFKMQYLINIIQIVFFIGNYLRTCIHGRWFNWIYLFNLFICHTFCSGWVVWLVETHTDFSVYGCEVKKPKLG